MDKNFPGFDPERIAAYFKIGEEFAQTAHRLTQASYGSVDPKQIFENQKHNMDALVETSRATAKVYENLFRDQVEIVKSAAEEAMKDFEKLREDAGKMQDPEAQAKIVQAALERATGQLTQLVETAAKAHGEALDALHKEIAKGAADLTKTTG